MVEIFKTNVNDGLLAQQIIKAIQKLSLDIDASFDLEDCDSILRIACPNHIPALAIHIVSIVRACGCSATLLNDDADLQINFLLHNDNTPGMGLRAITRVF